MDAWLKTLEARVRCIMEDRDEDRWPHTRRLMSGLSLLYGWAVRMRIWLFRIGFFKVHELPCKVFSIGNLTVGGTGKTPMTVYIARLLQKMGKRVAVLSRGYKGSAEKRGGMVSDGFQILMKPEQAGDEPYMLAHQLSGIPVLVGRDRYASGMRAVHNFHPDIIILDDGFQHMRLHRDLNLLLIDARRPFGNGRLLPRGKLREPVPGAGRADAVFFTRTQNADGLSELHRYFPAGIHIFRSTHLPMFYRVTSPKPGASKSAAHDLEPIEPKVLAGQSIYAFSGIADDQVFRQTLESFGLNVCGFKSFSDHHIYTDSDLDEILKAKAALQAGWLATTEKDFYRIGHRIGPHIEPNIQIMVTGMEISFADDTDALSGYLSMLVNEVF